MQAGWYHLFQQVKRLFVDNTHLLRLSANCYGGVYWRMRELMFYKHHSQFISQLSFLLLNKNMVEIKFEISKIAKLFVDALIAFACNAKRFAIVFLFSFFSPSPQCFWIDCWRFFREDFAISY